MAKKKGGKTMRREKIKPKIPERECPHCQEIRQVERIMVVGKGSKLRWRCKTCQTIF